MFKRIFNKFLDYVACIILGILGLSIFKALYILSFNETGQMILKFGMILISIIWAFVRLYNSKRNN